MLAVKGNSPLSGPDSLPESGHEAVSRISSESLLKTLMGPKSTTTRVNGFLDIKTSISH